MTITIILQIKIWVTLFMWALPLLIASNTLFVFFGLPKIEHPIFIRLLGVAYLSLVVVYYWGYSEFKQNKYPIGILYTGIISNLGASIIITISLLTGQFNTWMLKGQIFMIVSAVLTAIIASLLVYKTIEFNKRKNAV